MHKGSNQIDTAQIVVDFYNPQKDGSFVCSCYTPGMPASEEPEYLVRTVTYNELKESIADGHGMVNVALLEGESDYITFDKYLSQLQSIQIMQHCTDLINKREFRTHLYNHTSSLQKVS